MVVCAAVLVHLARKVSIWVKLTNPLEDISYGLYIYAFLVQQVLVHIGRGRGWGWSIYFSLSVLIAGILTYASLNLIERRVMHFKPRFQGLT